MYAENKQFYLKAWCIQPDQLKFISPEGQHFSVEPKMMEVLVCLAGQPEQVVSRDTLMNVVWKDCIVVEDTLTRCISQLRKLLRDDVDTPLYIETIRSKGYRLLVRPSDYPPINKMNDQWRWLQNKVTLGAVSAGLCMLIFWFGWQAGFDANELPSPPFTLDELSAAFVENDSLVQTFPLSDSDSMVFFLDKDAPNMWFRDGQDSLGMVVPEKIK